MGVVRLSNAGIRDFQKTDSFLAGNTAFVPSAEDFLEEVVLTSNTSSVTFDNLSTYSDYKHLQIRAAIRTSRTDNVGDAFNIQLNNDTGNNYAFHFIRGNGATLTSQDGINFDRMLFQRTATELSDTNAFGGAVIDFLDSFSTSKNKTVRCFAGSSGDSDGYQIFLNSGFRNNTEAITSIKLFPNGGPNFVTGCRFSLYGGK